MISYFAEDIKLPKFSKREISAWIKQVASSEGYKIGELGYVFCSDEKILEVNNQYLQHDYYTDIITFDYTEANIISGDIFISIDTVRTNAEKFGVAFDMELRRIIIHGVLHLCGQKDKSPKERAEMTRKENQALALLLPEKD